METNITEFKLKSLGFIKTSGNFWTWGSHTVDTYGPAPDQCLREISPIVLYNQNTKYISCKIDSRLYINRKTYSVRELEQTINFASFILSNSCDIPLKFNSVNVFEKFKKSNV